PLLIANFHIERAALAVDLHHAEIEEFVLLVQDAGVKGLIERIEVAGDGAQRTTNELVEVSRAVLVGIVRQYPCHVNIGRDPRYVTQVTVSQGGDDLAEFRVKAVGELSFPPTIIACEYTSGVSREGHARNDDLPGRGRSCQAVK